MTMPPANQSSFTLRIPYWIVVPVLLALIECMGFSTDGFKVSGDTISDSDTLMRLAYLRHVRETGLWQQGFFDRNNAPYGMVLHWTLPFNLFLLGLAKSLFFLSPDEALQAVGYWTGPIFCFAVAGAAYGAARQIMAPVSAAFAAGLIAFSPFLFNYADRGEANHHALLYFDTVVMAGLAFATAKRPDSVWAAILSGAMAGFCLWCSFELVILAGLFFAFLFIVWIAEGEKRVRSLLLSSAAFAAMTDFALLVDPPYGGWQQISFDHISAPFAALASLPLILALATLVFNFHSKWRRLIFLALGGALASSLWLLCFPSAPAGVEGAMDPYVRKEWLPSINEVRPLHGWREVVLYLGTTILALPLIPATARRNSHRVALLLLIAGFGVLAALHYRLAGYSIIIAAFSLAFTFDQWRLYHRRWVRVIAVALAGLLFTGFYGAEIVSNGFDVDIEHPGDADDNGYECDPYDVRDTLNGLGAAPIVADDINITPMLLYWTNVRTLAGNYHRDSAGIKDSYLFFRDLKDRTAQDIARRRGIDYVLVCADGGNLNYSFTSYARAQREEKKSGDDYKPDPTLYTRLSDQAPPEWLELVPWPDDVDSDLLLYRVVR